MSGYQLRCSDTPYEAYELIMPNITLPTTLTDVIGTKYHSATSANSCGVKSDLTEPVGVFAFPLSRSS